MSNAVRQSVYTASDSTAFANRATARASVDLAASFDAETPPQAIVIPSAEVSRAFDLFQPEPGDAALTDESSPFVSESAPSPVVAIADERFARHVARALDAPPPVATGLNLPLGGIAPTDREIDAARALIVGWIAACGIAAFAFLSQAPTVTSRLEDAPAPAPVVEAPRATQPGDIRLESPDPPAAAAPRPRKTSREPAVDGAR